MGYGNRIGKYQIGQSIGEGSFAKVKLAVNTETGQCVAMKVIDKRMVMENNLMHQVESEIRTMKLLHHPNMVRIREVIGTKTKIYIAMEYVSGGQLSNRMSYMNRLHESEARKYFQQLIDAIDYCHCRGVYHRDLKPQNLLLDSKGNLKVSDFGLSALKKPGQLFSTACGSPSYVAPELLTNKGYEGAAADVWSCGVILFQLLAGYLPFSDRSLMNLYRKILKAEYKFPEWFTGSQKKLISRILQPNPRMRITIPEIMEDRWFQTNLDPSARVECCEDVNFDDIDAAFHPDKESETKTDRFINAFQLIAMSEDLDLSGLFEKQDDDKQKMKIGSENTITETIQKIEAAAKEASLSVKRMNNAKMKIHPNQKMTRCSRSCFNLSAEVIEVAPTHCVVQVSKSEGELGLYTEFCKSLSSALSEGSGVSSKTRDLKQDITRRKRCGLEDGKDNNEQRGYSSS